MGLLVDPIPNSLGSERVKERCRVLSPYHESGR